MAQIVAHCDAINAYQRPTRACFCIGPQRGEKLCPCMLSAQRERETKMVRDGVIIDGKLYRLVPAERP